MGTTTGSDRSYLPATYSKANSVALRFHLISAPEAGILCVCIRHSTAPRGNPALGEAVSQPYHPRRSTVCRESARERVCPVPVTARCVHCTRYVPIQLQQEQQQEQQQESLFSCRPAIHRALFGTCGLISGAISVRSRVKLPANLAFGWFSGSLSVRLSVCGPRVSSCPSRMDDPWFVFDASE